MGKIDKIEALRGFVAIYVACGHILYSIFPIVIAGVNIWEFGTVGVVIFFLLSGFVIQYSYSKAKNKSFKSYFFKRFFRIYIPLFFVCAAGSLILCWQQNYSLFGIRSLAGTFLMLQDLPYLRPNNICPPFLYNMPLWSLSYEWWFYMIFFVVTKYLKDKASLCVYILSIIGAVAYICYPFFVSKVFLYMPIWWFGVELAKLYAAEKKISFFNLKYPLMIIIVLFFMLYIADYMPNNRWWTLSLEMSFFKYAFIAIVVALLWHKLKWKYFNLIFGLFKPFAKISYMLYISHWILIHSATYLDFIPNLVVRYTLYSIFCLTFCYLVEVWIYPRMNKFFMSKLFPKRL